MATHHVESSNGVDGLQAKLAETQRKVSELESKLRLSSISMSKLESSVPRRPPVPPTSPSLTKERVKKPTLKDKSLMDALEIIQTYEDGYSSLFPHWEELLHKARIPKEVRLCEEQR